MSRSWPSVTSATRSRMRRASALCGRSRARAASAARVPDGIERSGARVSITTVVDGETITQTREVGGGHGHFGMQDDLVQTVGLGAACEAEVTVRWPVKDVPAQTFTLQAGHRFLLTQGEDVAVVEE